MALTKNQKALLAQAVIQRVADMVEFPEMYKDDLLNGEPALADADPVEVREQLAVWMRRMPGTAWDTRLGRI